MATCFLIVIYLAFISLGLPDSLLGSAWPVMWPQLGAAFGSAGILSMIVAGGTIVSSLASSRMVSRLGTGTITLLSCVLTASALLGFSFSPSFLWLVLMAIPLGLGAGSVDAALNHYVAENYKAHHMNWLHCFWGVGATVGPVIMSYFIAVHSSWRGGYRSIAFIQFSLVIILLATLPMWKRVAQSREHEASQEALPDGADNQSEQISAGNTQTGKASNVLQIRGVKNTLISFLFYCGVEATIGLWGASFMVDGGSVTPETAAGRISLYYGGITVGRLLTGFFALRIHNRILIRYGQLVAISGGILLLVPLPVSISYLGFILIGLGLAPIYPGLLHETPARFGKGNASKLMGYQMAVAYTGTTILPPLFGAAATRWGIFLFPMIVMAYLVIMLISTEKVNHVLKREM